MACEYKARIDTLVTLENRALHTGRPLNANRIVTLVESPRIALSPLLNFISLFGCPGGDASASIIARTVAKRSCSGISWKLFAKSTIPGKIQDSLQAHTAAIFSGESEESELDCIDAFD